MVRRFRLLLLVLVVASSFLVVAPVVASDPVCTITGTEADDVLSGTAGADVICGLGGDDVIDAGGGDDVVFGGTGADVINGGDGADVLHGNEDNDEIYGDGGDDWLGGGQGDDALDGGDGADVIEGKLGADTLYGGDGDDELHGNEDNDVLHGDGGDDWLGGGQGDDILHGGDGADVMYGKLGADTLYGGAGNDELHGNEQPDVLFGDGGDDWLGGGKGDDEVHGGVGDDVLVGKKGDDTLLGGAGVDSADGSEGVDVCVAESEVSCEEDPSTPTAVTFTHPVEGTTVFHTETIAVSVVPVGAEGSVEFSVDSVVVGSAPIVDGSASFVWDTTTVPDGDTTVSAVVFDAAGVPATSAEITVAVGNESTGSIDRIFEDYDNGLITVDEYATFGLQSLMNPVDLPDRYASSFLVGGSGDVTEGTQTALMFLKDWDQMSVEVRQAVIGLGTVEGPVTGEFTPDEPVAQAAAAAPASSNFSDCMEKTEAYVIRAVGFPVPVFPKAFECRTVFDHATVYWNVNSGTFWDVIQIFPPIVIPLRKDALGDFSDTDGHLGEGNGVPDYIDRIGDQMDVAWAVYDDMGYSQPGSVNVYVTELDYVDRAPDGFVLPGPLVQFDNDGATTEYLPRHEQFHIAQYDHMIGGLELTDLLDFYDGTRWWMEATAEWAAHQTMITTGAPSAEPVSDGSDLNYSRDLPKLLNSPEGSLIEVDWLFGIDIPGPRSYGSFIFAEYLDENLAFTDVEPWLGGADAIRRTWDRIGDGATSTTPQRAIEEVIAESTTSDTLSTVLEGFGIANYLMDEPVHTAYGYTDPDAVDWKNRLDKGRPARVPVGLDVGVTEVGSSVLGRGGSHYVEFTTVPVGESGAVVLTLTAVDGVAYTALRVTTSPLTGATLCDDGIDPVVSLTPGVSTEVPVDSGCDTVTLVATYTDLDNDTRTAQWEARFEPQTVTRLVAQGSQYLWEFDGVSWAQLPALPGVDSFALDIETVGGEVFALVHGPTTGTTYVMRLTGGGVWVTAGDMAYPVSSPKAMAATQNHLYLLTEEGVTTDRVGVWRYDTDLSWTQVADIAGQRTGLAPTAVGGDAQVVFVVEFDPDPLNPARSTIWAYSETDGLRQGVFETASGPVVVFEGRLGMGASVDYGAEFILRAGGGFISTTDGVSWTFMAEPSGGASVMATHDGLVVFSDYSWREIGVQEGSIRTWDGTSTQVLTDPGLAMAWTSFQSDGTNLWMAGWRDDDDYSQEPVEGGVYRSTNGIDRVSVTTGIADLDGIIIPEILILEATP